MTTPALWRVAALSAALLVSSCGAPAAGTPQPDVAPARTSTTVSAVAGAARVRLAGRLVLDDATAIVAAPTQARIVRIVARPGTAITAGAAVVEAVLPDVLAAAAEVIAADARRAALLQRQAQLSSLRGAGLGKLNDDVELELALADVTAARARAEATLKRAGQRAEHAAALLDNGTVSLRSPAAGVVASVVGVVGDVVDSGEVIATIVTRARADGVRVVARSTGALDDATVQVANTSLPLGVSVVVPRVQAGDGAQEVWWRVAPEQVTPAVLSLLVDGAFVSVVGTTSSGVRVPRSAVLVDGAGTAVAIKNAAGAFVRTPVVVVGRPDASADHADADDVVVTGIDAGADVATTPRAVVEAP